MKLRLIIILLAATALLSGCRSTKGTTGQTPDNQQTGTVVEGDLFSRLTANYKPWTDVSVPVNIRLTRPTKFSISGRANLVRGKSIDISLRMLGFEMGRAFVTNDSAFVVVKPQRIYMAESLKELTKYVSFTAENIQDLLLGRPFLLGRPTLAGADRSLVEIETFDNGSLIKPRKQPSMANYGYAAGVEELVTKLIIVSSDNDIFKAEVTYGPHADNTPAGALAADTEVNIATPKASFEAAFAWKWNNAKWNSGATSDFSIPNGYKRVKATDLFKGALPK